MKERKLLNQLFDDLFHQIHVKDLYESSVNFIESCHTQFCRVGKLSEKQVLILARIRNSPHPNIDMSV